MRTVVIAHRGASSLAKIENTLEAFKIAIELRADYAEFDIRRTSDKKLIVFHNASIENKAISDISYKELCDITSKSGYTVPLLYQVLQLCKGKIKLDIELKEAGYEEQIIQTVKHYYDYKDYFMKSFLDKSVARIKKLDNNITVGLLIGSKDNSLRNRLNEYFPARRLYACKADFVSPYYKIATRLFIIRMHLHKFPVYTWTVNDPSIMSKLFSKKVDGIISDRPDIAIHLRNSEGNKKKTKYFER